MTLFVAGIAVASAGCLEDSFSSAGDTGNNDSNTRSEDTSDGGGQDMGVDADVDPDSSEADQGTDTGDGADLPADVNDPDLGVDASDVSDDGGNPYAPVVYRSNTVLSPLTQYVVESMLDIAANNNSRDDDVFMKVGASGTESVRLLYCLAGDDYQPQYDVVLDGRDYLSETIAFFRGGVIDDSRRDDLTTPFDRHSDAALSGRSAVWVINQFEGYIPLEREIDTSNPRFALINYGTNDMQLGTTYLSAMSPFYRNFTELIDTTIDAGIIPIISGLNPRTDLAEAAAWVPTYNTVVRGVAQAYQVPFIDLYLATVDLPSSGLVSDGLHGNAYSDGTTQPCVFTNAGLQYNYNVRNLLTIETLHQLKQTVLDGGAAPDISDDVLNGSGTPQDPWVIDALPFTHMADTRESSHSDIDSYPTCHDNDQDESGAEFYYRLNLSSSTDVRAIVLDDSGVDIDLHLLGANGLASECTDRNDRIIEDRLSAGTYTFSLDTFVSASGAQSGEYLFVILEP